MSNSQQIRDEAWKQKREATVLLCGMFKIPEGIISGAVERAVECIVSAAILESAALQADSLNPPQPPQERP